MSPNRAITHVQRLAYDLNVGDIEYVNDIEECAADVENHRLRILPVTGDETYAIALHELGHVATVPEMGLALPDVPTSILQHFQLVLKRDYEQFILPAERAAWHWARVYAIEWTAPMADTERRAMDTYLRGYEKAPDRVDREAAVRAITFAHMLRSEAERRLNDKRS